MTWRLFRAACSDSPSWAQFGLRAAPERKSEVRDQRLQAAHLGVPTVGEVEEGRFWQVELTDGEQIERSCHHLPGLPSG